MEHFWGLLKDARINGWAFLVYEQKKWIFGVKFLAGLPKNCFNCPINTLRKSRKNEVYYLWIFGYFVWAFFILTKKIQGCRNLNLSVQQKNVNKNTLEQLVFRHFGLWREKPAFLRERFWQGWKKQEKCLGTTVFSSFLVLDRTNLDFDRNFFGKVVESAFHVSKETLTEQLFRKEFQKISGFLDF